MSLVSRSSCSVDSIHAFISSHVEIEYYFSSIVWSLNIILFMVFLIELRLRRVKCLRKQTYLMVMLSMISSIISSTFFLLSQSHFFFDIRYLINQTCLFGPIIAISFRTIAKNFTWAFYIIRGQMVMESLDKHSTKIAKKAPYMLIAQCVIITTLIILFTKTQYIETTGHCTVSFPVWLLICSALFGELFYGLGFMYIFYKAMSVSMDHVYNSISRGHAASIKTQIRYHITIYSVQLISSLLFIGFVSSCVCFDTLVFFEAELFISNLCLMALFRNKKKVFKKLLCFSTTKNKSKNDLSPVRLNSAPPVNGTLQNPFQTVCSNSEIKRCESVPTTGNNSIKRFVHTAVDSENFLSDNWRGNATVHNVKAALKLAEAAPKLNNKALEMLGVTTTKNKVATAHHETQESPDSESILDAMARNAGMPLSKTEMKHMQSQSDPLSQVPVSEIIPNEASRVVLSLDISSEPPKDTKMVRPTFDSIGTKSEPVWTMNINTNTGKRRKEESPSVHLLDGQNDVDFVLESKDKASHLSSLSLTSSIVNRVKKGIMKRMSITMKKNNSDDKGENSDNDGTVYMESNKTYDMTTLDDNNHDTKSDHVSIQLDQIDEGFQPQRSSSKC
eukprot:1843_1